MSPMSKREYIQAVSRRYAQASKQAKGQILDEFCATLGYHRKAAIRVLAASPPGRARRSPARTYGDQALAILKAIWEAADFPWSVRLKALLPLWLPWAKLGGRPSRALSAGLSPHPSSSSCSPSALAP